MLPKNISNRQWYVESQEDQYRPSFLLTPTVNCALPPNSRAKNHMLRVLAFQELFGQFPRPLIITTKYYSRDPDCGLFGAYFHYF